jgi:hypothetical protein
MDDILRLIYPRQTTQHTYVEEVLGPDAFVIRKGRRFYELRLCSIRLPADSEHADPIASALSNVLLLERVTTEYCCLDENRQPRGVVTKIKSDPLLPHPVNRLLVDCGFAFLEPKCRNKCDYFLPRTTSVAGRTRNRFLRSVEERGDRQLEYLLGI